MLCVCSEHPDGPAGELETHGVGKRGQDPAMLVFRGSMNVHVLVNLESVVCVLH